MQDFLKTLNDKQREAVLHYGSPLLILAGAGSGKTRVITVKIAYLIREKKIDPKSILAVTFTNKAANEMKERVLDMVDADSEVMVRTFHSFGAWLLRRNAHLLGLSPHFTIFNDDDSLSLLKSVLGKDEKAAKVKSFLDRIKQAKNACLAPDADNFGGEEDGEFLPAYKAYEDKLHSMGNVDFGDLLSRSVELLRMFPEVRQRYRSRFSVVLVDEFQDSNLAQLQLLQELYLPENYLCVVGDEDQSIYSFRGAEVANILKFGQYFKGTKIIRLEQNYRSAANILEAAGHVVGRNVDRLGKKLWTENPPGEPIDVFIAQDQDQEAMYCATVLQDGNLSGTAICYRNNYQSRAFESLFVKLHIPYRIVGSVRFYDREETKDILAFLYLLLNPRDEVSFARIVNKPPRGIGEKTIQKILGGTGADILANCRATLGTLPAKAREGLKFFLKVMDEAALFLATRTLPEMVQNLVLKSGLRDHFDEKDKSTGTSRIANLAEFVNAIPQDSQGIEALSEFLETAMLSSAEEDRYGEVNRVTLITLHNTKGLEFDRVIITGLEEGLFPYAREGLRGSQTDMEEERRLFYVGITRARGKLHLTSCSWRKVFGQTSERYPSRFLKEIPADLIAGGQKAAPGAPYVHGERIVHAQYGEGVVTHIWCADGDEWMMIAQFTGNRMAEFVCKYAPLERMEKYG